MKVMIFDTETTNSIEEPIAYDVGYTIIDLDGTTYEKGSFVVAEVFLDEELMNEAYFKDKIPMYWEEIKNGKRKLMKLKNVVKSIRKTMAEHEIKIVVAHNMRFDYRSTTLTQRYLTCSKYRYFFPYGTIFWDSLKMAREIFKDDEQYRNFCLDNSFVTKRNQNKYTAEILYRYLTDNIDFIESHTGLEDAEIEKDIFLYCVQKKPNIDGRLWA